MPFPASNFFERSLAPFKKDKVFDAAATVDIVGRPTCPDFNTSLVFGTEVDVPIAPLDLEVAIVEMDEAMKLVLPLVATVGVKVCAA